MKKIISIMLLISLVLLFINGCTFQKIYTRTFYTMNTTGYITILKGESFASNKTAADNAVASLNEMNLLFSKTVETSDIFKLNNANGAAVTISDFTLSIIKESIKYNKELGGFDITIKTIIDIWDITGNPRVPTDAEITEALAKTGVDKIVIEGNNITLKDGIQLDLGAIAKGYAVAVAADILKENNVTDAIINVGGNIFVLGKNTKNETWRVGVRDPEGGAEDIVGTVISSNKFFVSSGSYERFFIKDGVTYHHIMDPLIGKPSVSGLLGVLIVSEDGTLADILSTAFFVLGKDKAIEYLKTNPVAEAVFITTDKKVIVTDGLKSSFVFSGNEAGYSYDD